MTDEIEPPQPLPPEPTEEPTVDGPSRYEPPMPRWLGYIICGFVCLIVGASSTLSFKVGAADAKTQVSEKQMADARDAATICTERLQEMDTRLQLLEPHPTPNPHQTPKK